MGMIARETIELVRQRSDIVEIIGSYLPLQRAGAAYRALCPFHKEKTPSFFVHPARQIYHCFGCKAGGDVIRFVMEYEKFDFAAAVRMLAARAGVAVQIDERERAAESQREALLRLHEAAARFFEESLARDAGAAEARDYLARRRLDGDAARRFRIGWAPNAPDAMVAWGRSRGFDEALLEAGGLVARGERGLYDRFRNRLMFPICDEQGRVIGFSGRVLPSDSSPAKYVNSPETPLFQKGRVLYALDKARRSIIDKRQAILCEGQIDCLRCHIAGLEHAVAAQGTAVTEDHARTLKRYADEVVVMLDADTAGQEAAIRTAQTLLAEGLAVRLASLPPGQDPDSLILQQGAAAVDAAVAAAEPTIEFVIRLAASRGDLASDAGRMRVTARVMEVAGAVPSPALREQMLARGAPLLGISVEAVRKEYAAWQLRRRRPAAKTPASTPPTPDETDPVPEDELQLAEICLHQPKCRPLIRQYLPLRLVTHSLLRDIVAHVLDHGEDRVVWPAGEHTDAWDRMIARLEMSERATRLGRDDTCPRRAAQDCILRLWKKSLVSRRRELLVRLETAQVKERNALKQKANTLTLQVQRLSAGGDKAFEMIDLLRD